MGDQWKKLWGNKKRWCSLLLVMLLLVQALCIQPFNVQAAEVTEENGVVNIQRDNYTVQVLLDGFRYGFYKSDGTVIADKHGQSGICFGPAGSEPSPAVSSSYQGMEEDVALFTVTNANGQTAQVGMHLFERYVKVEIHPDEIQDGDDENPNESGSLPKTPWEEVAKGWPSSPELNTALLVKGTKGGGNATVKMLDIASRNNYVMEMDFMIPGGTSSLGLFSHYVPTEDSQTIGRDFNCFYVKAGNTGNVGLKNIANNMQLGDAKGYEIIKGVWYQLKMVVEDSKISTYINNNKVYENVDNTSNKEGPCGFRIDKLDSYIDNIRVYDQEFVYYQNDFENTTLSEVNEQLKTELGSSEMELKAENTARPDLNSYLVMDGNRIAQAVTGTTESQVQRVQADLTFTDGDEETGNSLVFGYQDNNHYYGLGFLKSHPEQLVLYKVTDGVLSMLQEQSCTYAAGTTYRVKAEIMGNTISGSVNEEKLVDQVVDESVENIVGQVGIRTSVSSAVVDNFTMVNAKGDEEVYDFNSKDLSKWTVTENLVTISNDSEGNIPPVYGSGSSTPGETETQKFVIDARVEGINPLYGLGDYGAHNNSGGVRTTSNVFGTERTTKGSFTNMSDGKRFISNFTIAPQRGFAQVLFEESEKRVSLNENQTMLGVLETPAVETLYYFFGSMEEIYSDYKKVRNEEGYEDTKPHYEMFGLGWEAFGSLGWNAYQSSVMDTVKDYVNSGYDITWAVIGSGFWPGDRKGVEGTTTSFGMWDDTVDPNGRNDGLPNPRFPDPDGMKSFFKENNIKLLLGLRTHFKLPADLGGKYDASVDGTYPLQGLANDYYIKNEDGSLFKVAKAKYPTGNVTRGNVGLVDGANPDALEWYRQGAALWGVDGFKEDAMISESTYHDGNWNRLLSNMVNKDDSLVIVRNGAYSLPGDVLRINDANYGTNNASFNNSPDRMPINLLSYAASGVSNVYPDIVGGTGGNISDKNFQKYVVRNAQMAALTPSISVGINVLKMDDQENKDAAFHAINWHSTYAPYVYDAALKSWETGYPTSMTPLYIAYPQDETTYDMISSEKRQFEWLLGESILAAPLFGTDFLTAETRDVYLPEGTWIDYNNGQILEGPVTITDREYPKDAMPIYIGGKGILVGEDMENKGTYFAEVFPVAKKGSVYSYTYVDGEAEYRFTNQNDGWSPASLKVVDTTTNSEVGFSYNQKNGSFKFAYEPGHNYELRGGEGTGALVSATLTAEKTVVSPGQEVSVSVNAVDDSGANLTMEELDVKFSSSGNEVVKVNKDGTLKIKKNGEAEITAEVRKKGDSSGKAVITNAVKIQVVDASVTITGPYTEMGDDFESGSLSGWKDIQRDYEIEERDGGKVAHYKNSSASARGTMLLGNDDWTDYTMETDLTLEDLVDNKTAGLVIRYEEYNSCYLFVYTHGKGLRYIKRNLSDGSVDAKDVAFTMESGKTYHLKAEAAGNQFTLYVDGVKMMEVTDEAKKDPVITGGPGGLYASGMEAVFDNVQMNRSIGEFPFDITGTAVGTNLVSISISHEDEKYQGMAEVQNDGSWRYPVYYLKNGDHIIQSTVPGQEDDRASETTIRISADENITPPDRTTLQAAIDMAEKVDESKYTKESVKELQEKLESAREVLAGQANQDMLDQSEQMLLQAIENLKEKKEEAPGGNNPGGDKPADDKNPQKKPGKGNGNIPTVARKPAKTGDNTPILALILSMAGSLGAVIWIWRKSNLKDN